MSVETVDRQYAAVSANGRIHSAGYRLDLKRWLLGVVGVTLTLAAWPVSTGSFYSPGSGFGYAIGIIGSVMMLLMLLYPLRKHARWARSWGPLRYWFLMHMVFGIGGPALVLFHSTFHVKSLNATVSLYSMLLVASSGVIGRFIYRRIHHGLYGRRSNLEELQRSVDDNHQQVSAILMEAPDTGEKLRQFRAIAADHSGPLVSRIWKFLSLGWRRRKLAGDCNRELRRAVDLLAQTQGWDVKRQDQHWREAATKVSAYLGAVQQAAQHAAYERLFRLWHVLHTPFVWMLGISAVIHVVAVNMY